MSTATLTIAQSSQAENDVELQPTQLLAGKDGPTLASFSAGENDLPESAVEAQLSGAEYRAEEFNEYWKLYLSYFFRYFPLSLQLVYGPRHASCSGCQLTSVPPTNYISSAWGDRLFEFACPIFIIDVYQTTLLPSSVYGFCTTGAAILFSDAVGKRIDRTSRLRGTYSSENVASSPDLSSKTQKSDHTRPRSNPCREDHRHPELRRVLGTVDGPLSRQPDNVSDLRVVSDVVFAIVVALGCVYKLATVSVNIAISRDWVVIIADGKSDVLTSTIKHDDAPRRPPVQAPGIFLRGPPHLGDVAVYVVGAWNVLSLVLEYVLIYRVYMVIPILARHKAGEAQAQAREMQAREERKRITERIVGAFVQKWRDWLTYCNHPVFFGMLMACE
ncbi:hypothetical protein BC938DRAFT_478459 [Jimgerdemannia flammicorona]|uniref:Solute carrier family 40 member n=1 Tax=Jimgerdemannia flammicorona TaxID=994334 RepID=A0A433QMU9_9FUNG|nr:hypothetical protein BC938DRAFT_478459 [Jimgerdemannia flammicorona]